MACARAIYHWKWQLIVVTRYLNSAWLAALRGAAMLNYLPQGSRHANGLAEE